MALRRIAGAGIFGAQMIVVHSGDGWPFQVEEVLNQLERKDVHPLGDLLLDSPETSGRSAL